MLREMQQYHNELVKENTIKAMIEIKDVKYIGRLRQCKACVMESDNYYFLNSYNTTVAIIDKKDNILYDALKWVCGYTATTAQSAQHIAKFKSDYGRRCREFKYYPINSKRS